MPVAAATQGPHQIIEPDAEGDLKLKSTEAKSVTEFSERWSNQKIEPGLPLYYNPASGKWERDDPTPPVVNVNVVTTSNTKAEIIDWLMDNGVTLSQSALAQLTKAELLDLVDDLTN